jgi:hypothetical protein
MFCPRHKSIVNLPLPQIEGILSVYLHVAKKLIHKILPPPEKEWEKWAYAVPKQTRIQKSFLCIWWLYRDDDILPFILYCFIFFVQKRFCHSCTITHMYYAACIQRWALSPISVISDIGLSLISELPILD